MSRRPLDAPATEYEIIDKPALPIIQELVDYWEKKRAGRMAPSRAEIDPAELKAHLPHIHLIDVIDGGADFRYRLVGTSIVQGLGRDNTGKRVSELYGDRPEVCARIIARFALVVTEKRPIFSRGRIWWMPDRNFRGLAGGSVPLSDDGVNVNIILSELFVI
ncbi:MAG TPA: PAS domain-containing protein [Candidatus Cybelea sp.]|nr:PAS domain-containing protein [Candidatus Cybelea sp.]